MKKDQKRRVLILHDYGTLNGGAEHMSATIRTGLRARGYDARFLASTARPQPLENIADYECFGSIGRLQRVTRIVNPSAIRELRSLLSSFQPDVVHLRMFMTQLSPAILPLLSSVPTVLHVVNYDLVCPANTKLLPDGSTCNAKAGSICHRSGCVPRVGVLRFRAQSAVWRRWRDACDVVVANSAWVQRRLTAEGVAVDEVVWNGVPALPERPKLTGPPTVAFAGRLYAKKGVDVLIRAMPQVLGALPHARLLIAGDGPERDNILRSIEDLDLSERVAFLGHLPQEAMERELSAAWVQVVPSVWEEPFGLVAAEAQMRGTAVVASDSGGLSEIVRDGETGHLVPPGDSSALGRALVSVLQDRAKAESMGARARAFALAELTEDRAIERFGEIYDRLLMDSVRPDDLSRSRARGRPALVVND